MVKARTFRPQRSSSPLAAFDLRVKALSINGVFHGLDAHAKFVELISEFSSFE